MKEIDFINAKMNKQDAPVPQFLYKIQFIPLKFISILLFAFIVLFISYLFILFFEKHFPLILGKHMY